MFNVKVKERRGLSNIQNKRVEEIYTKPLRISISKKKDN